MTRQGGMGVRICGRSRRMLGAVTDHVGSSAGWVLAAEFLACGVEGVSWMKRSRSVIIHMLVDVVVASGTKHFLAWPELPCVNDTSLR